MYSVGALDGDPGIALRFVEEGAISKAYAVTGEPFSADEDGIWLDARMAAARGRVRGRTP